MDDRLPRKLAVILHADVVGSTSLVQKNESLAHTRIQDAFERFASTIESYNGTTHELRGDALVAEFARGSDAVGAALAFQTHNTESNACLEGDLKPQLRIGISLGEVVVADSTVTGAGVVLAQRVEQLAEPDGVCITGAVHEAVPQHLPLDYSDLGKQDIKGFAEPVQVYGASVTAGEQIPPPEPVISAAQPRGARGLWAAGTVMVVLAVAGAFAWYHLGRPDVEPASVENMAFPLPDKPSIAVLPFNNLSGDAEQDFLADGLSEEIITTLSKIPKLFVIARNSTFAYKGKAVPVKQVAEEQGVRYVLEGSLQRSGDRIRINAQLIDALEGHHLWAERYDSEFKDIFALQDDITRKIMVAMQVNLTEGEVMRTLQSRIVSAQAFEYFLKGRDHFQRYNKEDNAIGRQLVQKAAELEPDNPAIWVQSAWYDFQDARFGWSADREASLGKVARAADKAYALNPDDAKVNGLLGSLSLYRGKHDEAIAYARRAVELAPGDALEIGILAWILAYSGYPEEAIPLLEKAMRLSPYYPAHFAAMLGLAHMMIGEYRKAIVSHEYLVERKTLLPFAYSRLAGMNAVLGNQEKARAYAAELLRIQPSFNIESWSKVLFYRNPEDRERELDALRLVGLPEKPPLPLPDKPSIAVLPFTNLTGDSEQDYLVDGFTNEIITNLSKFPEFFVIASNSVFTFKGKSVRVDEVGRTLGVRYVLEGSVQRSVNNVTVHAQLIEAASEQHIWAERYEVAPEEIFSVHEDLTRQITITLAEKIIDSAHRAVSRKDEMSLPAYELYLKAVMFESGKEAIERQIRLLERAIELEPDFAGAYAMQGAHYLNLWRNRLADDPDDALRRAKEAARKAVSIDQQDYRSHWTLGKIYLWADRDHDLAMAEFEKALALNPNQADVMSMMSLFLAFMGRSEEAVDWTRRAMRLNPHYPAWYDLNAGFAYYMARDYDKALLGAKKTLAVYPESLSVLRILAATYVEKGEMEKAREVAQKMLEIDPDFTLSGVRNVPFRREVDRKRYFGALAKAGLPE